MNIQYLKRFEQLYDTLEKDFDEKDLARLERYIEDKVREDAEEFLYEESTGRSASYDTGFKHGVDWLLEKMREE